MYIPSLSLLYLYRHSVTFACVTHSLLLYSPLSGLGRAHGVTCHCSFLLLLFLTAAQFLHDNGVLLHYNDHLRGLNNLYFIDPAWLCDMLAEVITVPEKNAFARNGILADANVAFLFKDTRKFPPQYLNQYLQLLERFEIALSLGDGTRLIPSMLSVSPPACNFSSPLPMQPGERGVTPIHQHSYPTYLSHSHPSHSTPYTPSLTPTPHLTPHLTPHTDEMQQDSIGPPVCIKRRYLMVYIPSGFWSRLITRIMINFSRTGLVSDRRALCHDTLYWRRGIYITYQTGKFLVQALDVSHIPFPFSIPVVGHIPNLFLTPDHVHTFSCSYFNCHPWPSHLWIAHISNSSSLLCYVQVH